MMLHHYWHYDYGIVINNTKSIMKFEMLFPEIKKKGKHLS